MVCIQTGLLLCMEKPSFAPPRCKSNAQKSSDIQGYLVFNNTAFITITFWGYLLNNSSQKSNGITSLADHQLNYSANSMTERDLYDLKQQKFCVIPFFLNKSLALKLSFMFFLCQVINSKFKNKPKILTFN